MKSEVRSQKSGVRRSRQYTVYSRQLLLTAYCLLLTVYFFLTGCATSHNKTIENKSPAVDGEKAKQYDTENYQPLFDYTYDGEKNITRYNILGPFITIEKDAQKEERTLRPFYS